MLLLGSSRVQRGALHQLMREVHMKAMKAMQATRAYGHVRPAVPRPSARRRMRVAPLSSTEQSSNNSAADAQLNLDALLYQQVVRSRNRPHYAAGQVALDQPLTLFFRKCGASQDEHVGCILPHHVVCSVG